MLPSIILTRLSLFSVYNLNRNVSLVRGTFSLRKKKTGSLEVRTGGLVVNLNW